MRLPTLVRWPRVPRIHAAEGFSVSLGRVTLSLADGATVHEVADALGHANPALVLSTYGHALPEKRAEVFSRLGARIFG